MVYRIGVRSVRSISLCVFGVSAVRYLYADDANTGGIKGERLRCGAKDEMRLNLIAKIRGGEKLFPVSSDMKKRSYRNW